ncbi:DEAD/DEAH box helicase [Candidatus Methylospira mobilis]|uniref:DEAD/DEAH box helicase n=2 Tax=Candidatus Methylospira mobilis TaxID=1808979 RepID=A0A5Q0BSX2_9GAMM|nr:DEAD/DEAH box helicase [Candidatus Methylospira mobilis]
MKLDYRGVDKRIRHAGSLLLPQQPQAVNNCLVLSSHLNLMPLTSFHPAVSAWFNASFPAPTACQAEAWTAIKQGRHTLIAAPTGSGKTLAAFLAAIDELVRRGFEQRLEDNTQILYISPLKALSNDVQKNLEAPLAGIQQQLQEISGIELNLRAMVRSGDTPVAVRTAMLKHPPHILVTTPESVYILLTSEGGRRMLKSVRTVIVDEIHAIIGSKRGAHLALSLERLQRLTGAPLARIGLSATQSPIETVADFLVGATQKNILWERSSDRDFRGQKPASTKPERQNSEQVRCKIIDSGHLRQLDLALELPDTPLEAVLSNDAAKSIHERMAELIGAHHTTLVFVNTRRMAERLTRALSERLGEDRVTSHHGSLACEQRLSAECRLKNGELKALVATASLELGIDVGDVDLVCQLGTTGSISVFLQRVGRSGHFAGGVPKGRLFPTTRDELVECLALLNAIRRRELDQLRIPSQPLDVLAQQIVAMVACEDWQEDDLFDCVRIAWPYRVLERQTFDDVVNMLTDGFDTRAGLRSAHLYRDAINKRLSARRGARLTALTCGGAIPDNADYRVILEPSGDFIGSVDEDFAIESMAGDVFQLGNASWRVLRLEAGRLRVEDAQGVPPSIPFWFGEAPGRTHELSLAVSRLRVEIAGRLQDSGQDIAAVGGWLQQQLNVSATAAGQAVAYLSAAAVTLGVMPSFETVVFERFFDESGGMQFIIHAPFGSRVNRAWGLALRKRFCRGFNFELQAAATENAVILSLSTSHSFPLDEVARYLNSKTVRDLLIQALLAAPMFTIRWRWNAVCALALRRFQGGKKTPPHLLRMQAEDLVASVFPDQLACLENIVGDRQIPDHPLVFQTIEDCLTEAMDIERLLDIISGIEQSRIQVVSRDLVEPSPLAAEIVNARVYSFLDGAPLEERRTRAVASRRWLDPSAADDLGKLDADAIERVRRESWPEAASRDEFHDALNTTGFIKHPEESNRHWAKYFEQLQQQNRVAAYALPAHSLWIAAERLPQFQTLYPELMPNPSPQLPDELLQREWSREQALVEILRARLGALGPVAAQRLADDLALPLRDIDSALLALQTEGFVLAGRYTPDAQATEWCERRLLARIHYYTLHRLRQEIEPVTSALFMRYLLRRHQLLPDLRGEGPEALAKILNLLEGCEAAAIAWESDLLPARLQGYDPAWLDALCLSGKTVWLRASGNGAGPVKSTPITLLPRRQAAYWHVAQREQPALGSSAQLLLTTLRAHGASFFEELAENSGMLKTQAETALEELVGKGLVNADSFKGLRALLTTEDKKRRYRGIHPYAIEDAGRWAQLKASPAEINENERLQHIAGCLLKRYGVLFRALLTRETLAPSWQDLLPVLRRMEARGEIRGGRFIAGQYGEQFALPETVEALRALRKQDGENEICVISASDPLNLLGILLPGPKIAALPGNRILFRAGIPVAVLAGKETKFLAQIEPEDEWAIKNQLQRKLLPPQLKAYL